MKHFPACKELECHSKAHKAITLFKRILTMDAACPSLGTYTCIYMYVQTDPGHPNLHVQHYLITVFQCVNRNSHPLAYLINQ